MYSGEYKAISSDSWQSQPAASEPGPGVAPLSPRANPYRSVQQILYGYNYGGARFAAGSTPKVILSLMGYQQAAPSSQDSSVGFLISIKLVTHEYFVT